MARHADIAIIGAGAGGLFASIWAGRTLQSRGLSSTRPSSRIVALDGAKKLGAKILVAGGGRCNVTHHAVDETAYAGSSRNSIRNVLRRFDVAQTIEFFRERGVELKREETGKLFPVTDDAQTVLDALLNAAAAAGVQVINPWRVASVKRTDHGFAIQRDLPAESPGVRATVGGGVALGVGVGVGVGVGDVVVLARRIILATGGRSLPKTGSDGLGFEIAKSLGHSITPRVFPALVPLTIPKDHWLTSLSGVTLPATLELRSAGGKRLAAFTNSTLITHFGLSGPGVLDMSRYYTEAKLAAAPGAAPVLVLNWLPEENVESMDAALASAGRTRGTSILRVLEAKLAERVVRAICEGAGVDPSASLAELPKIKRRTLAIALTEMPLPVTGDRGYLFAEATAGGVPLAELKLDTMESRVCPGLHVCGELCDVDGRVGGFNFQWAWASGYVAGCGAAAAVTTSA
ncbi:MAG: aminoacetone oxidase family FAD-binding enzyme [Phycisphaeraceae bacterium]|nr:aminoacetone oxidase family FAD-binding enzyme [Phycisphaeraceae bacterium]